jgi:hypothetical protein
MATKIESTAVPISVTPESEFAGMTITDCCDNCCPEKCVISGIGHCSHPAKGGLQAAQMNDPAALARYRRAKRLLRHQKVDIDALQAALSGGL